MVAYATPEQVKLAVARDPDKPVGSAATLGFDQIQLAIDQAQAEIDARCRPRYVVPFAAPVPGLVSSLTIDIACYRIGLTWYQEKDIKDTDPIARRYKKACCVLDDIASGLVVLDTGAVNNNVASTAWYGTPVDPSGDGFLTSEFYPYCYPDGWWRYP